MKCWPGNPDVDGETILDYTLREMEISEHADFN
jgi:hypothetical protein